MKEEILGFISRFTNSGQSKEVIDAFTCGCCYWFALILYKRFSAHSPTIVYDQTINHFATEICGCVYDITGDVTNQFSWAPWESVTDTLLRKRVVDNCVMFTR